MEDIRAEAGNATDDGLVALAASVDWLDADAQTAAQRHAGRPGGVLHELAGWFAGVLGHYPPPAPTRVRLVRCGGAAEPVDALAAQAGVGVRAESFGSLAEGVALADAEVDAGCDLMIVTGRVNDDTAALAVSALARAEPVAVLPRGAAAVDTKAWIARAEFVRDRRAALVEVRDEPDEVLTVLADDAVAGVCGLIVRATARRTAVILDGDLAVTAALVAHSVQPRCALWWRVADTSTSPIQAKALEAFRQQPVLDLRIDTHDGIAALLVLAALRTAVELATADHAGE